MHVLLFNVFVWSQGHKEVDISPERLTHDYDIRAERLPFRNIKQIIEDQNFAVKLKKTDPASLERLTETFPAMIAYKDGTWHILAQVAKVEEEVQYQIIELKPVDLSGLA